MYFFMFRVVILSELIWGCVWWNGSEDGFYIDMFIYRWWYCLFLYDINKRKVGIYLCLYIRLKEDENNDMFIYGKKELEVLDNICVYI